MDLTKQLISESVSYLSDLGKKTTIIQPLITLEQLSKDINSLKARPFQTTPSGSGEVETMHCGVTSNMLTLCMKRLDSGTDLDVWVAINLKELV